jgi:hypothetical protein
MVSGRRYGRYVGGYESVLPAAAVIRVEQIMSASPASFLTFFNAPLLFPKAKSSYLK